MSATVRISKLSHEILKQISDRLNVSMVEALDLVTDNWQRQEFLRSVNAAYDELKKNKLAWEEVLAERKDWDGTMDEGLGDEGSE